jgi:hypothetical protein
VLIAKQHAPEEFGKKARGFDLGEESRDGMPIGAEALAK